MQLKLLALAAAGVLLVAASSCAVADTQIPGLPVKTVGDSIELELPAVPEDVPVAAAEAVPVSKEAEALAAQIN
ncbi:hypothetical protein, partial [Aquimonas sp.]|uniref:hypothetical protein n=1 Tax=Aquimonas sp. TaxID=1872588 RepID=UPI0037BF4851